MSLPAGSLGPSRKLSRWALVRLVLFRFLLFALLWWILSEGTIIHPAFTAGLLLFAVWASLGLVPPGTWNFRVIFLPAFVGYFLRQSLLAGIDVAGRAFDPRLPLSPDIVTYHVALTRIHSRIFFVWIVSLLPGTAGVCLDEEIVSIHVLDSRQFAPEHLDALAWRIKRLMEPD